MIYTATQFIKIARKKEQQEPFPFLVPSILLSFAAVEAGVNALIHYALRENRNLPPPVKKYVKKELEASPPASIIDKIQSFTYFLTGESFDTQSRLWERFQKLRKLRNKIIHYELEELKEQEVQSLAKVLPIKTKNGDSSTKTIRETFYKNLFSREVTIDRAVEASETASEILEKLYSFYYSK